MGQALCGSHTTTEAVRLSVKRIERSVRAPAQRHGISPTAFQKWRNRTYSADARMGRKAIHCAVITPIRRCWPVALRSHMLLLPVNVCLNVIKAATSHQTRSALHCCRPRQGIRRLKDMTGNRPAKIKFETYLIGYFQIDIAEVRTEEASQKTASVSTAPTSSPSPNFANRPIEQRGNVPGGDHRSSALRPAHYPNRQRHHVGRLA